MVENAQNQQVPIEEIITEERPRRAFEPMAPVADIPTPLLTNGVMKTQFLLAANAVRLGLATFEVAIEYEVQVGEPEALRRPEVDFVSVPGVSPKLHVGPLTKVAQNQEPTHDWYITVCDSLRSNGHKKGWTSMRTAGIFSFKILSMRPGPIFNGQAPQPAQPPMMQMFESVYQALTGNVQRAPGAR